MIHIENVVQYNFKVADLYFEVSSFPDKYTEEMLKDYFCEHCTEDAVRVECTRTKEPLEQPQGTRLTERSQDNWYLNNGVYTLCIYDYENDCICANMHYDNANSHVSVTLLDVQALYGVDTEFFLYNVLERVFRTALVFNGGFAVHASSVVHEGYGLAFSAQSGTGKSTHTDLWIKNYPGTYILNDDAPAFRMKDGMWHMYGTPWAGTSGINVNVGVPVKALVFLERSQTNTIRDVSTAETISRIFEAIMNPISDEITNLVFDAVSSFITNSRVCVLGCNISDEAPKTVKKYLF